jgi:hypothetical protein
VLSVCKELGRPFPRVSDDDVIDYVVGEAVTLKWREEQQEAQKQQEGEQFRGSHKDWKPPGLDEHGLS